ncbi:MULTISPECIES: phosphoribosylglycinamide formyltransferase [Persicobacter]|uniref:Phosphoribosylglycinamide formyltransferase n=1 Tax=Persicobacter diffluens TaxID=981 RepID=A0AAN5AK94_9BACT|nr:phosphoribosylglycinamide formyltransferase [Persicobacter sp. CCB-QB2]GJM61632.1 phosphoribosylglycinamide formyltransferase [Persicobacter diffluens]
MKKIAIFASGSGSNAQKIVEHFQSHSEIEVSLLLCNKPEAYCLTRAKNLNIPSHVFTRPEFKSGEVLKVLQDNEIDFIVLAGFLWLVPENLVEAFPDRIINIHPALLPKFGGKGMYGMNVHQAVVEAGECESGITIHYVNAQYDEGQVIFQATTKVSPEDSAEDVAQKIHALEYKHFPAVIQQVVEKI